MTDVYRQQFENSSIEEKHMLFNVDRHAIEYNQQPK